MGDGGLAGVPVPGEGASSSSVGDVGDSTNDAFVNFSLVAREDPERPLAIELASALSLLDPSSPERTDPDARGLSVVLSS